MPTIKIIVFFSLGVQCNEQNFQEQAKAGMKVERSVYGPRGEVLVSRGSVLTRL